jgi:glycogen debranching enzyme
MSYLVFEKSELVNLEYSLNREILSTNRAGGYFSTTIVLCNTRKYHGLMVLPLDQFDGENHVLLSSVDETVVQHGKEFNLGIHRFPGIYEGINTLLILSTNPPLRLPIGLVVWCWRKNFFLFTTRSSL